MQKGNVKIEKTAERFITVIQEKEWFYGQFRESSNKQYLGIFHDGHLEVSDNKESWINGSVCMIENENLLWTKEIERPIDIAVSDNGIMVIVANPYRAKVPDTKPVPGIDLGGEISVIDKVGNTILEESFTSNVYTCAISSDGKLVFSSTLIPDDSIYCFNIDTKQQEWKYKNHDRNRVLGLSFIDNIVKVSKNGKFSSNDISYELNSDGILIEKYARILKNIDEIKKHPIEQAIESLLLLLKSKNRNELLNALVQLRPLLYDKKSPTYYLEVAKCLKPLLDKNDKEIFDLVWKIITTISRKDPHTIDCIASDLINRIKKLNSEYADAYLWYFDALAGINPLWLEKEIPTVIKILENSESHNEKRFAQSIMEQYNKKIGKYQMNQFPDSKKNIQLSITKTYSTKTKDHLLSFSNGELVARIGWTKPSKLIRFDKNLDEKWKIVIDGRVRAIESDEHGTIVTESTFVKNQNAEPTVNSNSDENQDGVMKSSLYIIDNDGNKIKVLERTDGFIGLIGITREKILMWNDVLLSIKCLDRNSGDLLWEKSYQNTINSKYNMRTMNYSPQSDQILTIRTSNKLDKLVIPSIISVLDNYGNIISEFESDGFPSNEQLKELNNTVTAGSISISIPFHTHYPIYHAFFINDSKSILAAYYNGQVACWSIRGNLEWVFDCKNKVKLGLSITSNGLVSALCENGDYYLIENGKEILHSKIDIDYRNSYQVLSAGEYAVLSYDNKLLFFERDGKVGELEFENMIRSIAYDPKEKIMVVSAQNLSVIQMT